jgi:hypothetical protein
MSIAAAEILPGKRVTRFVKEQRKLLIDGQWDDAASGETFPVYNPATGEVIAHAAEGDKKDIDRAVTAARRAFESGAWPRLTPSERGRLVWKLGDLILEHLEELAELESMDNGKPVAVARAADVPLAADLFHYMAGWATKIEGNTIPLSVPYTPGAKYLAYTLREPVGVVAQIIPWNFPLLMAAWKLAPALAATRGELTQNLKVQSSGMHGASARSWIAQMPVVIQVALSVTVLAGAGLLLHSLFNLETMDVGFDDSRELAADASKPHLIRQTKRSSINQDESSVPLGIRPSDRTNLNETKPFFDAVWDYKVKI